MKKFLLAATLGATAVAGVAVAQQATTAAPAQKMRADANSDGNLTRQEAMAAAEGRFARMDANKDGTVTREERQAARAEMRSQRGGKHAMRRHRGGGFGGRGMMIERLDTDKDGKLSRAEASAPMQRRFEMTDTNKDGFIDKAEADAARAKMREMRGQRGRPAVQPTPGA